MKNMEKELSNLNFRKNINGKYTVLLPIVCSLNTYLSISFELIDGREVLTDNGSLFSENKNLYFSKTQMDEFKEMFESKDCQFYDNVVSRTIDTDNLNEEFEKFVNDIKLFDEYIYDSKKVQNSEGESSPNQE